MVGSSQLYVAPSRTSTQSCCGRSRPFHTDLLRGIEHRSACERADGLPGPEVAWLRAELGLDTEPVAV